MNTRKCLNILAGLVTLTAVGCMPELTIEMMKEMQPQRPAELDKLNAWVGEWVSTSEIKIMGLDEVLKGTGKSIIEWDNDRWCMVEHAEYTMGELGSMHALGVWTWDSSSKKFRTFWTGSMGDWGTGTVTSCTCCGKHWSMKARGKSPWGTTIGRGTVKFVDNDTMEWTWTEWASLDLLRLFPMTEMTGTSKRQ